MKGLAQQLYYQKTQKTLGLDQDEKWPTIKALLELNCFSYADYALAELFLKDHPQEEAAALICFLSLAARNGNLCIKIDENIKPDPLILCKSTSFLSSDANVNHELLSHHLTILKGLLRKAALNFPLELITHFERLKNAEFPNTPVCSFKHYFYLQRFWIFENQFINHLKKLVESSPQIQIDNVVLGSNIFDLVSRKHLTNEQAEAIKKASSTCLFVLTGGPGTGKTYTAGNLIRLFLESMPEHSKENFSVAIAAPTGKATANLQKSLDSALLNCGQFKLPRAQTVHSLLGLKHTTSFQQDITTLSADLILIDECSMLDIQLMIQLFKAIKPGARLILLGDPFQLPPIDAGSEFSTLSTYFENSTHHSHLNLCLRTDLQLIVDFAKTIRSGNPDEALKILTSSENSNLSFYPINTDAKITQNQLVNYTFPLLKIPRDRTNPESILQWFNSFRLLSPIRKGPLGVDEINKILLKKMQTESAQNGELMVPILITQNNSRLDLFNGEIGVLVLHQNSKNPENLQIQKGDYAIFYAKDNVSSIRKLPALLLPPFDYAFCLSIHKSQGSEFDHVLMVLPEESEIFGRPVLYTGATRAKKKLEIWASEVILKRIIASQNNRLSGISQKIIFEDNLGF